MLIEERHLLCAYPYFSVVNYILLPSTLKRLFIDLANSFFNALRKTIEKLRKNCKNTNSANKLLLFLRKSVNTNTRD